MGNYAKTLVTTDKEIKEFLGSVGFLIGGLCRLYDGYEKTANYQNLIFNTKDSAKIKSRLWSEIEIELLSLIPLDDEVAKSHMLNIHRYEFIKTKEQIKRKIGNSAMLINIREGYSHFKYLK